MERNTLQDDPERKVEATIEFVESFEHDGQHTWTAEGDLASTSVTSLVDQILELADEREQWLSQGAEEEARLTGDQIAQLGQQLEERGYTVSDDQTLVTDGGTVERESETLDEEEETLNGDIIQSLPQDEWVPVDGSPRRKLVFGQVNESTIQLPVDDDPRQNEKPLYEISENGSAKTYSWTEVGHRIKAHVDTQPDVEHSYRVRITPLDN